MLDKVRLEHGDQLALEVADQVMHHPLRDGEAPQRHALGGRQQIAHPLLRRVIEMMESHLDETIPVPELADRAGVSQRKLERLFRKHTGASAIGYYRMLRLELARVLLTHTSMSIRDVSVACGFFQPVAFRQVVRRPVRQTPQRLPRGLAGFRASADVAGHQHVADGRRALGRWRTRS